MIKITGYDHIKIPKFPRRGAKSILIDLVSADPENFQDLMQEAKDFVIYEDWIAKTTEEMTKMCSDWIMEYRNEKT